MIRVFKIDSFDTQRHGTYGMTAKAQIEHSRTECIAYIPHPIIFSTYINAINIMYHTKNEC